MKLDFPKTETGHELFGLCCWMQGALAALGCNSISGMEHIRDLIIECEGSGKSCGDCLYEINQSCCSQTQVDKCNACRGFSNWIER